MWRIFEALTRLFTRFAYTPPGYAAAGSPAARQRIAADRRADTIQKTADRQADNAPIQAINAHIQAEKKLKQAAETAADSGCNTADRHKKQPQRIVFYPCMLSLFSHCIQYRKAGKPYQGREGSRQKTEGG